MPTTKDNTTKSKESPKDILLGSTVAQLSNAMASLKDQLGEKKFEKRIRKAAKLLLEGVKTPAPVAATPKKKATVKKDSKPAPAAAKTKKATVKVVSKKNAAENS